ncbi:glutathione S-transferase [Phaeobacter sp. J2-8]|uniref:glutathione S-transferase n=1 Tax=Phaeobacter sp. J2-8 TaxID=2931394 RepID=UPI001FD1C338|nr:glutathione S-transferase [Phaeobacter sp. J2-8]MCJ7872684.1 glutathione S-transferase [Phaeobacter sp. J2-8]
MSDILHIGDYAYSSWSLRGWLLYRRFGLACRINLVNFAQSSVEEQLNLAPARTVPSAELSGGGLVWDSLAMAEELAARHPDRGFWPKDPTRRATARSLAAEMHSGFGSLRSLCPMNMRLAYDDVPVPDALAADLARLEKVWDYALTQSGGPWLCGEYSVADAFYAPVAARIAGYGLPVGDKAAAYVARHLADPAFRRFRAMGLVRGETLQRYAMPYPTKSWPGPTPEPAAAVAHGPSVNATCPYSGDAVTDFLEFRGSIWGFCNPFCRDKSMVDPTAWPDFIKMVDAAG